MPNTAMITAVGGPLDGIEVPCRNPDGLALINKPKRSVLVYDRYVDRLIARDVMWALDDDKAARTADRPEFDVLAYDAERMGPWQR